MATHYKVIAAESTADMATVVTALNTAIAAQVTASAPQPVIVHGYTSTGSIAVGPLKLYVASVLVQYEG
jgi:hypothetical protein